MTEECVIFLAECVGFCIVVARQLGMSSFVVVKVATAGDSEGLVELVESFLCRLCRCERLTAVE